MRRKPTDVRQFDVWRFGDDDAQTYMVIDDRVRRTEYPACELISAQRADVVAISYMTDPASDWHLLSRVDQ